MNFRREFSTKNVFLESTLKSALSKAKHEFDLAAEMVQLIEQGTDQKSFYMKLTHFYQPGDIENSTDLQI